MLDTGNHSRDRVTSAALIVILIEVRNLNIRNPFFEHRFGAFGTLMTHMQGYHELLLTSGGLQMPT